MREKDRIFSCLLPEEVLRSSPEISVFCNRAVPEWLIANGGGRDLGLGHVAFRLCGYLSMCIFAIGHMIDMYVSSTADIESSLLFYEVRCIFSAYA